MAWPGEKNLRIWAGNTTPWNFIFSMENGNPFDLSGSRLVFKTDNGIRWATDDVASPFTIHDAVNGVVWMRLTPTQSRLFTSATTYEIELWSQDEQYTLQWGVITPTIKVNDDVNP